MKNLWLKCFCMFLVATLFGCGGGGGGGGGARITTETFTAWSSVDPPVKLALTGLSQDTVFELVAGNPPFDITVDEFNTANVTATITYRANGSIERIDIATPRIDLSWDKTTGDIISDSGPFVYAGDPVVTKFGVLYNPLDAAADPWEYQTFGAWADARPIAGGTVGALSFGTPTPGNAIPVGVIGEVVPFTGHSAGIYTTGDGTAAFVTQSTVNVDVDFLARELAFRTTGTTLQNIQDGNAWADSQVGLPPSLDLVGTLSYAEGVNSFQGTVDTVGANGPMTGTSAGRFYGPAAQELGGVFSLTGPDGLEHYSGAYGAAQ